MNVVQDFLVPILQTFMCVEIMHYLEVVQADAFDTVKGRLLIVYI